MTDPWFALVTGVGGIALGSLIAGAFGLIAPRLQSRREHARWLRETRLVAYSDFLSAIDLWMDARGTRWLEGEARGQSLSQERETALEDEVARTQSRVVLLGPDPVRFTAAEYHHLVLDHVFAIQNAESLEQVAVIDTTPLQQSRGLLLGVMNRVLGIGPAN